MTCSCYSHSHSAAPVTDVVRAGVDDCWCVCCSQSVSQSAPIPTPTVQYVQLRWCQLQQHLQQVAMESGLASTVLQSVPNARTHWRLVYLLQSVCHAINTLTLPCTLSFGVAGMMAGNTCPSTLCRAYPGSVAGLDGGTRLINSLSTSSAMRVPYTNAVPVMVYLCVCCTKAESSCCWGLGL